MGHQHIDFGVYLKDRPTAVPSKMKKIFIVMMVLGLGLVGMGFMADREHSLAAFVVNFMYWAGICQGGFMLAVALTITTGRWARPLKRMAEGFGLFMIPLYLCLMVFLLTGGSIRFFLFLWLVRFVAPGTFFCLHLFHLLFPFFLCLFLHG